MNPSIHGSTNSWKARVLGSVAALCMGTTGYSSGCGGDGSPSPPPVEVDVSHIEWTIGNDDPAPRSRTVGVTQADGLATSVQYQGEPAAEWLRTEVIEEGGSLVLLFTASAQGLEPGNYAALVLVSADEHESAMIDVVLTVTP